MNKYYPLNDPKIYAEELLLLGYTFDDSQKIQTQLKTFAGITQNYINEVIFELEVLDIYLNHNKHTIAEFDK